MYTSRDNKLKYYIMKQVLIATDTAGNTVQDFKMQTWEQNPILNLPPEKSDQGRIKTLHGLNSAVLTPGNLEPLESSPNHMSG